MVRLTTIALHLFNGISALFGGGALLLAPDGSYLKMPTEMLKFSPFSNYTIPGLILFVVLGIGSLITSLVVIRRVRGYPFLTIFMGFAFAIWISVQILMLRQVHFLHILYGTIGIILIIFGIFLRRKEYGLKN